MRVVAPLVLVAALPGCTRPQPNTIAPANRVRATGPEATLPIAADTSTVDLHPGGSGIHAIPWVDAAVAADGRSLIVRFESRGSGCDWLDHIDTRETDKRVRITVYLAENPDLNNTGDGPLTTCAAPARYAAARVPLTRPLRGRTVVDAASGDTARPVARLADA